MHRRGFPIWQDLYLPDITESITGMEGSPGVTDDLPSDSASHAPAPFSSSRSGEGGENKLDNGRNALEMQVGKEGGRPPVPDKGTKRQRPDTSCTTTKMRRHSDTSDSLKPPSTVPAASPIVDASLNEAGSGREALAMTQKSESRRSHEGSSRVRSLTPPQHSGHGQPGGDTASTRLEKAVLGGLAWSSECRYGCLACLRDTSDSRDLRQNISFCFNDFYYRWFKVPHAGVL